MGLVRYGRDKFLPREYTSPRLQIAQRLRQVCWDGPHMKGEGVGVGGTLLLDSADHAVLLIRRCFFADTV